MRIFLALVCVAIVEVGCTSPPLGPTHVRDIGVEVRDSVTVIEPVSGDYVGWAELLFKIDGADVVLLGELHDHAVGHAVQLAIVEDVMDKYPKSILALEMLERDEQPLLNDYMEDFIDAQALETLTHSTNWGSRGGWQAWYQPIIDCVKERGGAVVAANAPRRYVRLARTGGYSRIDELPPDRRKYIDYPEELSGGRYRERFWEFATHHEKDSKEDERASLEAIDPEDPNLPMFRSQQAWDATMAQSIVNALPSQEQKVILLVGQFHVEYDGGIVQELRRRLPEAKVLVVSIQREIPEESWQGHPAIADFMIVEHVSD